MMVITLGRQYNIGEKPTVILYTYIDRHAGTPEKQRKKNKKTIKHGSNNILLHIGCEDVVVVSHVQCIGCQPEKTTLRGGQSRSWSAEQGKNNYTVVV